MTMTSRRIEELPHDVMWGRFATKGPNVELVEQSGDKWELAWNGKPIMYCGVKAIRHLRPGGYLWMLPTAEFDTHPLAGFRSASHWLNHYMREAWPSVWCVIDPEVQGCARLVEMLGFRQTAFTYAGAMRIYEKDI